MRKSIGVIYFASVAGMFAYTLFCSERASDAAYSALVFCGRTLVPQLFVGTALAKMLFSMPMLLGIFSRFGERGCGLAVLLMGLLCGAQTGAVVLGEFYKNGCVSKKYAERALCFCGGASASFLIGFIGVELKGNVTFGIRLLAAQAVFSLALFLLAGGENGGIYINKGGNGANAISEAAVITLTMCGSVVFFTVVSDAVSQIFPENISGYISGALEFSGAVSRATSDAQIGWDIGFGGLCVLLQIFGVTSGLDHKRLVFSKVACGVLLALLTKALA